MRPIPAMVVRSAAGVRLAPRIAAVLAVKVLGLAVLWFLFVRDQRVAVDARTTAVAFGLGGAAAHSEPKSEGHVHGQ